MKAAGFVLTGGQSKRMGRDKALLRVGGETLCEHVADLIAPLVESVRLVGRPERYGHLKYGCIPDRRPDFGPLSGLEAALEAGAELNVIAACDLWNLKECWLRELLKMAANGTLCSVVEDGSGQIQPLIGVYRKECAAVINRALTEGRLRLTDLLKELGATTLRVDEIILNVNTPREYDEITHGNG